MSIGTSLDSAISGLNARVESARRAAGDLARMSDKAVTESNDKDKASQAGTEDGKGSFIDVTA